MCIVDNTTATYSVMFSFNFTLGNNKQFNVKLNCVFPKQPFHFAGICLVKRCISPLPPGNLPTYSLEEMLGPYIITSCINRLTIKENKNRSNQKRLSSK
jgi:hypothetical protein